MYGRQPGSEFERQRALSPREAYDSILRYLYERGSTGSTTTSELNEYDKAWYRLLMLAEAQVSNADEGGQQSKFQKCNTRLQSESPNRRLERVQAFLRRLLLTEKQEIATIENGLLLLGHCLPAPTTNVPDDYTNREYCYRCFITGEKIEPNDFHFVFTGSHLLSKAGISRLTQVIGDIGREQDIPQAVKWLKHNHKFGITPPPGVSPPYDNEYTELVTSLWKATVNTTPTMVEMVERRTDSISRADKKLFTPRDIQRIKLYIKENTYPKAGFAMGAIAMLPVEYGFLKLMLVVGLAHCPPLLFFTLTLGALSTGAYLGAKLENKLTRKNDKVNALKAEIGPAPIFEKGHLRSSLAALLAETISPKPSSWHAFFASHIPKGVHLPRWRSLTTARRGYGKTI